jgi:predicted nucleotidyltransferase
LTNLEELFKALNDNEIKYLLIGSMASILYGVPRTTLDFDIAISPSRENVQKTLEIMMKLGMSCDTEHVEDILAQGGISFSNDLDIDVLTGLPDKEDFEDLWNKSKIVTYEGVKIKVISKEDQIRILRKIGRKQDLDDANILSDI